MGSRRRAREHALKVLYQADVAGVAVEAALSGHWSMEPEPDPEIRSFAEHLVRSVSADRDGVDALIAGASHNWKLDRMDAVERNVLRLAVGEMRGHDAPPAVVIDEAVELAREYGGSESHAFVNGILEAVRRSLAST